MCKPKSILLSSPGLCSTETCLSGYNVAICMYCTVEIPCPGKSYSKMYGTEPRYNDLRYNDNPNIHVTMSIWHTKHKIVFNITILLGQAKLIFRSTDFFLNFQGRSVGKKCKKNKKWLFHNRIQRRVEIQLTTLN